MTTPIFILSLPRSGSTLLQKILGSHSQIATTPEPHLLSPMIYAFRNDGAFAEYHQPYLVKGLNEFCETLPDGKKDYDRALRQMAEGLYEGAANGCPLFLDITPAYSLHADELIEIFPDAKFILLLRNPISVIASAIELYGKGKWRLFYFNDILHLGFKNLIRTIEKWGNKVCIVYFENLISDLEKEVRTVVEYLHLDFEPEMVTAIEEKMGNPNTGEYSKISSEHLAKWKRVMNTPLRKIWFKRYLKYIGHEEVRGIGYDPDTILRELKLLPNDYQKFLQDFFEMPNDMLKIRMKYLIFKKTSRYL